MKTYFSLFVFLLTSLARNIVVQADDDEVSEAFADGALMTFLCPAVETSPCFDDDDSDGDNTSIAASVAAKVEDMMQLKWNRLQNQCDDRRRLRGPSNNQDKDRELGGSGCGGEPYFCTFFGRRRHLENNDKEERKLDAEDTVRGSESKEMKAFLDDFSAITYNSEEEACMAGIVCSMEWVLTNCDD